MASLTDKEKELLAVGTAIGAGCQPCTQYHVQAALKAGLPKEQVQRAIDDGQAVRREGGVAVANVGRRLLKLEHRQSRYDGLPSDRAQALVYIGAAAGSNAGSLLAPYLTSALELGLCPDELRSALEVTEAVKKAAADFLRRDVERVLRDVAGSASADAASELSCCASGCNG